MSTAPNQPFCAAMVMAAGPNRCSGHAISISEASFGRLQGPPASLHTKRKREVYEMLL